MSLFPRIMDVLRLWMYQLYKQSNLEILLSFSSSVCLSLSLSLALYLSIYLYLHLSLVVPVYFASASPNFFHLLFCFSDAPVAYTQYSFNYIHQPKINIQTICIYIDINIFTHVQLGIIENAKISNLTELATVIDCLMKPR